MQTSFELDATEFRRGFLGGAGIRLGALPSEGHNVEGRIREIFRFDWLLQPDLCRFLDKCRGECKSQDLSIGISTAGGVDGINCRGESSCHERMD